MMIDLKLICEKLRFWIQKYYAIKPKQMNKESEIQTVFNSINTKLENEEDVTINEREFWCGCLYSKSGDLKQLPEKYCDEYKFMKLLRRYMTDLSFSSNDYVKLNFSADISEVEEHNEKYKQESFDQIAQSEKQSEMLENGLLKYVDAQTIEREKSLLEKYAEEWDNVISIKKHSDQHLQRVCKHARDEKKKIEEFFRQGNINSDEKKFKQNLNLWKTKMVFIEGNKIVETIKKEFDFPFILKLKGREIFYTFDSIVHILNRHFAELISHNKEKSFNPPVIPVYEMHIFLRDLFCEFDKCDLFKEEVIKAGEPLSFKYDQKKFQIHFKVFNGLFQIDTLYPIEYETELEKLINYNLVTLNDNLALYIRK